MLFLSRCTFRVLLSCYNCVLLFSHSSFILPMSFLSCYYSSHVVFLTLPLLSLVIPFELLFLHRRTFQVLVNLPFVCSFRVVIAIFLALLLCFAWLVWYFPYPCHVHVGAWSFNTNLSTKGKFHCIFSFFLDATSFFVVFVLFFSFCCFFVVIVVVVVVVVILFYFFILCCFFSLCNNFIIDVLCLFYRIL